MRVRSALSILLLGVISVAGAGNAVNAAESALKSGDHVAIIGDSITEQKQYSRNIAVYLLACSGVADLDVAQFGWSGETAGGLAGRCLKSIAWFKPTVATTCYGMNDGKYTAYTDEIGKNYKEPLTKCVELLKQAGVREIVLSSPGAVDTISFKRPSVTPEVYNANLAKLGELAKAVADAAGVRFADTHGAMIGAMAKAKAVYGEKYNVCGGDGVHPDANGHLLMAGSLLAALGCDGEIARITLKAAGTAEVSAGHRVVKAEAGAVDLESTRWPFVLTGDGKSPNSNRSIVPYTDFVERLDRFTLVMPDCAWAKVKVGWGDKSVVVTGEQLKQGVNLMALFEVTPFDQPENALSQAVGDLQNLETSLVKGLLNFSGRPQVDADPESKTLFDKLTERQVALRNEKAAAARALLKPVAYRITVAKAD